MSTTQRFFWTRYSYSQNARKTPSGEFSFSKILGYIVFVFLKLNSAIDDLQEFRHFANCLSERQ